MDSKEIKENTDNIIELLKSKDVVNFKLGAQLAKTTPNTIEKEWAEKLDDTIGFWEGYSTTKFEKIISSDNFNFSDGFFDSSIYLKCPITVNATTFLYRGVGDDFKHEELFLPEFMKQQITSAGIFILETSKSDNIDFECLTELPNLETPSIFVKEDVHVAIMKTDFKNVKEVVMKYPVGFHPNMYDRIEHLHLETTLQPFLGLAYLDMFKNLKSISALYIGEVDKISRGFISSYQKRHLNVKINLEEWI